MTKLITTARRSPASSCRRGPYATAYLIASVERGGTGWNAFTSGANVGGPARRNSGASTSSAVSSSNPTGHHQCRGGRISSMGKGVNRESIQSRGQPQCRHRSRRVAGIKPADTNWPNTPIGGAWPCWTPSQASKNTHCGQPASTTSTRCSLTAESGEVACGRTPRQPIVRQPR